MKTPRLMLVTPQAQIIVATDARGPGSGRSSQAVNARDAKLFASFHQLLQHQQGAVQFTIGDTWHQSVEIGDTWHQSVEVIVTADSSPPLAFFICLSQKHAPTSSSFTLLHHVKQIMQTQLSSPLYFALSALEKKARMQNDSSTYADTIGESPLAVRARSKEEEHKQPIRLESQEQQHGDANTLSTQTDPLDLIEEAAKEVEQVCLTAAETETAVDEEEGEERIYIGCDEMDDGLEMAEIQRISDVKHALLCLTEELIEPLLRNSDSFYSSVVWSSLHEALDRVNSLTTSRELRGELYLCDVSGSFVEVLHHYTGKSNVTSEIMDGHVSASESAGWMELQAAVLECCQHGGAGRDASAPMVMHIHAPLFYKDCTLAVSTYGSALASASASASTSPSSASSSNSLDRVLALLLVVPSDVCHLPSHSLSLPPPLASLLASPSAISLDSKLKPLPPVKLGEAASLPHWLLQCWSEAHVIMSSSISPLLRPASELPQLYRSIVARFPAPFEPPGPAPGTLSEQTSNKTKTLITINQIWLPPTLPNLRSPLTSPASSPSRGSGHGSPLSTPRASEFASTTTNTTTTTTTTNTSPVAALIASMAASPAKSTPPSPRTPASTPTKSHPSANPNTTSTTTPARVPPATGTPKSKTPVSIAKAPSSAQLSRSTPAPAPPASKRPQGRDGTTLNRPGTRGRTLREKT